MRGRMRRRRRRETSRSEAEEFGRLPASGVAVVATVVESRRSVRRVTPRCVCRFGAKQTCPL